MAVYREEASIGATAKLLPLLVQEGLGVVRFQSASLPLSQTLPEDLRNILPAGSPRIGHQAGVFQGIFAQQGDKLLRQADLPQSLVQADVPYQLSHRDHRQPGGFPSEYHARPPAGFTHDLHIDDLDIANAPPAFDAQVVRAAVLNGFGCFA